MGQLSPRQALSSSYRQAAVGDEELRHFTHALRGLLECANEGQREEELKMHLRDFLRDTFYAPYRIGVADGDIDLAVRLGKGKNARIGLIVEVKSLANRDEMLAPSTLNRKALHELLLYYLRERVANGNTDLKYLVATNALEFFIFDALEFERKFYSNRELVEEFEAFSAKRKVNSKTEFFYREIAYPRIGAIEAELDYTYVNLRDYQGDLSATSPASQARLRDLYRLFSPTHLLKLAYHRDSNTLDQEFYHELLHIIGIEERKDSDRTVIVRKAPAKRNSGSLLENTICSLVEDDCLRNLDDTEVYGNTPDEQLFNIALELCITWINRILFLKLLEAQLLRYHGGEPDYRFLTPVRIRSFGELNSLFFSVLALKLEQREGTFAQSFARIPYLNSSLFEITDLERGTIKINSLSQSAELPVLARSVLRGKGHHLPNENLPTLHYLFAFLDSYNFANDGSLPTESQGKTLISASVLGLIFEKINGHRDGAVFTPGYITMFICREAIGATVVQAFNNHYGWRCGTLTDLYNRLREGNDSVARIAEANAIIDGLRICDPAVGSGHFLVSALNELVRIKFDLGVLADSNGRRISPFSCTLSIENDELVVLDGNGNPFAYNPANPESQRLQETLFREKRRIIEGCLFGVDINPNAVKICRLRLWIELLKNAYYTRESGYSQLETLPNIDINIKQGNALLHRIALGSSLQRVLRDAHIDLGHYRDAVAKYKHATSKDEKKDLDKLIKTIKKQLRSEIDRHDPRLDQLGKKRTELEQLSTQLFPPTKREQKTHERQIAKLQKEIGKIEAELRELREGLAYRAAMEWRIEYPELLDGEGNFTGFDLVLGNPPYIHLQSLPPRLKEALQHQGYTTHDGNGDIYCLFYELGWQLLKEGGYLCYITSNKWMRAAYGQALRQFLSSKTNPLLLVDFAGAKIFGSATVDTNILLFRKGEYRGQTRSAIYSKAELPSNGDLSEWMATHSVACSFTEAPWVVLDPIAQRIKAKVEAVGVPLRDWDIQINYGIKTGYNEAFVITTAKRDEILANCRDEAERARTGELIRPVLRGRDVGRYRAEWAGLWLVYISWHFPLPEEEWTVVDALGREAHRPDLLQAAERAFAEQYPALYAYLQQHEVGLRARNKEEVGRRYEWYALQRYGAEYTGGFRRPKMIWKRVGSILRFCYDERGMLSLDSTCIAVGNQLKYLCCLLNSKMGHYLLQSTPTTGTGDLLVSVQAVEPLLIPPPRDDSFDELFNRLAGVCSDVACRVTDENETPRQLEAACYALYGLDAEEIAYIEAYIGGA
ncbi:MAG: Eco57I restriction-modification methylase domain-containing protein [Bacteroides sp.]